MRARILTVFDQIRLRNARADVARTLPMGRMPARYRPSLEARPVRRPQLGNLLFGAKIVADDAIAPGPHHPP